MPDPHLRAADSDRGAVAAALGQAMSEGRLTVVEYDERLAAAYAARTFGELAPLTADLPRSGTASPARPTGTTAVATAPAPAPARGCAGAGAGLQHWAVWGSWSSTALIVLTIWAITSIAASEFLYFWPFWVIVPWGGMLLMGQVAARAGRRPGS
jgi:hypothetical protein